MDKLLREYLKRFKENFPIMSMMDEDEETIISIIEKCLKEGKPYSAYYKVNAVY